MVCKTFNTSVDTEYRFQMHSNESSAHNILNLVPNEERSVVSAYSPCEKFQRYKSFDCIIRMESQRHSRLVTWCWLNDVDAKREGKAAVRHSRCV